ncbi:MAG TPA: radical SAM protein [Planctomycetota bacterium]|nr:radical SAM protein [Planctomycetota bacterium]
MQSLSNQSAKKRVLIVNAFLDDARRPTRRPTTVLKAMGPPFLAGAFDRDRNEVRLWDEQSSGPLEDQALLGWPDMLVLTGMTAAFDRMLHLAAYARTKNAAVRVVAGGPAIRTLPQYAARFFDDCCLGDIEQMAEIAGSAFGPDHVDREMTPRYDLAYWLRSFGHVESTRYCNFRCSFCSMTAEDRPYQRYDLDVLRRQIEACGRRRYLLFIDNNFYGNNREHFLARLELIGEMRKRGWFRAFGALVTSDFFLRADNVEAARDAGCEVLFCGLESFDAAQLDRFHKAQNKVLPQVELVRRCLEQGVLLVYGLIADVSSRRIADLRQELDFVTRCPEITLPTFVVLPIPFPGTPFFADLAQQGRLLPRTRLRDLDGTTLCIEPLDPMDEVARFVRDLQTLRGHRWNVVRHAFGFLRRYGRKLSARQLAVALARDVALLGLPSLARGGLAPLSALLGRRNRVRTHVSTTEPLDRLYTPAFPVAPEYRSWFEPTTIVGDDGRLVPHLADQLLGRFRELPATGTSR